MAAPASSDLQLTQPRARALGDPTRHRLFELIAEGGPVTVAHLAGELGIHVSAVRQHLEVLSAAGLIVDAPRLPNGRGRPARRVELAAGADRYEETPYQRLALLLLEALRSGQPIREVGRTAGRRAVAEPTDGVDPVAELATLAARSGFSPRVEGKGDDVAIVLDTCPFAIAATRDPGSVCALHLGILEGAAEAIGGVEVCGLEVHDPQTAGCRVQLQLEPRTRHGR